MTIKEQLAPRIREIGINETSRRTGIDVARLSRWLKGTAGNLRLGNGQLDNIAESLGAKWILVPDEEMHDASPIPPRE